jgi:hypothetical protein
VRDLNPVKSKNFLEQQPADSPAIYDKSLAESNASPRDGIHLEDNSPAQANHHSQASLQQTCAPGVPALSGQLPADLKFVIETWTDLSEEIKEKIMQLILQEERK